MSGNDCDHDYVYHDFGDEDEDNIYWIYKCRHCGATIRIKEGKI